MDHSEISDDSKTTCSFSCKERVGVRLFKLAGISRIYIIGYSRSGTTMLHYTMLAFYGANRGSGGN